MKIYKYKSTIAAKLLIQFAFFVFKTIFHVNEKKVTFASYRAEELTGNLYFVYKELEKSDNNYKYHFLLKKYKKTLFGKFDYFFHMIRASYFLATSKCFFIDDYYFPVYVIKPRKGTKIVQLWHAAGAFKKFGYSTVDKEFGPTKEYLSIVKVHSNYSYAVVSSSEVVPFYAEAFNMPEERVLPLGVPRTDFFFDKKAHDKVKEKFYYTYPELRGKKLALYAPTFRGKSHNPDKYGCPIDFEKFSRILGEEFKLIIHLHPYVSDSLVIKDELKDSVYNIDNEFTVEELLVLADFLITDYSSIVFDYSLMEKPMAFFADDLESYESERGFYFDYKTFIPGPLFDETEELANWIKDGSFNIDQIKVFKNKFFNHLDGEASKRVIHYVLK